MSARSAPNASRSCPSTPGAPLLALTRRHASQTIALGITNGLSSVLGMFARFLPRPQAPVVRSDIPDQPAPWLHRQPSKQRLHGYYGPVRQRTPRRYSMPPVSAVGRLPLATLEAYNPGRHIDARLLTFRARAADQAHAASTPGTAWPIIGTPARLITGEQPDPPLSMPPRLR